MTLTPRVQSGSIHLSSIRRAPFLTPDKVRTAEFTRTPFGRRGYNENEVRLFLDQMAEHVAATDAETASLRAEIDRLRNWYRQHGVDVDDQNASQGTPAPHAGAVSVLPQAQQARDSHGGQAEDYAHRLVVQARQQYEDVLQEAQRRAQEAAEHATAASRTQVRTDDEVGEYLERKIAYLRTFAETTQVQLRSMLDALTREVDTLNNLPTGSVHT